MGFTLCPTGPPTLPQVVGAWFVTPAWCPVPSGPVSLATKKRLHARKTGLARGSPKRGKRRSGPQSDAPDGALATPDDKPPAMQRAGGLGLPLLVGDLHVVHVGTALLD